MLTFSRHAANIYMHHLYARCNIFYGFYIIFAAVSNNAKFNISFIGCNKKGKLVASFNRLQPLKDKYLPIKRKRKNTFTRQL